MPILLKFFSITFFVSWSCFIAAIGLSDGPVGTFARSLIFIGTVSPSFVALWLTARVAGTRAVDALIDRVFEWRVGARWYVFAVSYMAAIKLTAAVLHRALAGTWPRFGGEAWYILAVAMFFSTWVQAGEEIGWRGFALPRLSQRLGLAGASVLLGVIWACWHLPFFFVQGADTYGQSFPMYLLQVTALSVAMAWLYAHTNGSLLLVMLMHSAINQTKDLVPSAVPGAADPFALSSSLVGWITGALLWTGAAYFLVRMPRMPQWAPEER